MVSFTAQRKEQYCLGGVHLFLSCHDSMLTRTDMWMP